MTVSSVKQSNAVVMTNPDGGKIVKITNPDGTEVFLDTAEKIKNFKDPITGGSLLHTAALKNYAELAQLCLQSGLNALEKNASGWAPYQIRKSRYSSSRASLIIRMGELAQNLKEYQKYLSEKELINAELNKKYLEAKQIYKVDPSNTKALASLGSINKSIKFVEKVIRDLQLIIKSQNTRIEECSKELTRKIQKKEKKESLKKRGSLKSLFHLPLTSYLPSTSEIIQAGIFVENDADAIALKDRVQETYNCKVLKRLMDCWALESLKKKNAKALKCFVLDRPTVNDFRRDAPLEIFLAGLYTHKRSIYVGASDCLKARTWGIVLHEATHYVMKRIFKNVCNPYLDPAVQKDEKLRIKAENVGNEIQKIIADIYITIKDKPKTPQWATIRDVFKMYKKEKWAVEMIAKVPEIIATYGNVGGLEWLENNTFELLKFYEEKINPEILKYLQSHNYRRVINLDRIRPFDLSDIEKAVINKSRAQVSLLLKTELSENEIVKAINIAAIKGYYKILALILLSDKVEKLTSEEKCRIVNCLISHNKFECIQLVTDPRFNFLTHEVKIVIINFYIRNNYQDYANKLLEKLGEEITEFQAKSIIEEADFCYGAKFSKLIAEKIRRKNLEVQSKSAEALLRAKYSSAAGLKIPLNFSLYEEVDSSKEDEPEVAPEVKTLNLTV